MFQCSVDGARNRFWRALGRFPAKACTVGVSPFTRSKFRFPHLDRASATASGPAGNRSCPDASVAARYTASATSDSVVTTVC